MVSKAREDLPEPDSPVITVSRLRGISRLTFLRLCCRAPRIVMRFIAIKTSTRIDENFAPNAKVQFYRTENDHRKMPRRPGAFAEPCRACIMNPGVSRQVQFDGWENHTSLPGSQRDRQRRHGRCLQG